MDSSFRPCVSFINAPSADVKSFRKITIASVWAERERWATHPSLRPSCVFRAVYTGCRSSLAPGSCRWSAWTTCEGKKGSAAWLTETDSKPEFLNWWVVTQKWVAELLLIGPPPSPQCTASVLHCRWKGQIWFLRKAAGIPECAEPPPERSAAGWRCKFKTHKGVSKDTVSHQNTPYWGFMLSSPSRTQSAVQEVPTGHQRRDPTWGLVLRPAYAVPAAECKYIKNTQLQQSLSQQTSRQLQNSLPSSQVQNFPLLDVLEGGVSGDVLEVSAGPVWRLHLLAETFLRIACNTTVMMRPFTTHEADSQYTQTCSLSRGCGRMFSADVYPLWRHKNII